MHEKTSGTGPPDASNWPADKPTPRKANRLQAALDELQREQAVRRRCYDRWISNGDLSLTDARDRMERLQWAIDVLRHALGAGEATPVTPEADLDQQPIPA